MRSLCAAFVLFGLAGHAAAQSRGSSLADGAPSHSRVPPIEDIDPAQFFADRMKQLQRRGDLAGLLKQFNGPGGFDFGRIRQSLEANPQLLNRARETLRGINLDDPQYAGMIESILRSNNWNVDPAIVRQLLQNFQQGSIPSDASTLLQPRSPRPPPSAPRTAGTPDDDTDALRQKWAREIANWASNFPKDKLNGTLRDSPALKKLFEEIAGAASRSGGGEGLDAQLARWQKRWESMREWLPQNLPSFNLSAADIRLPELNLGAKNASGASTVLGTVADLLPVLYVVLGAAAVWAVVRGLRSRQRDRDPALAALGPWPIAPHRIENRDQFIRAFDYLAQRRCGPQARSWHHRAVARQLPRNETERAAVDELAGLYEWARYSPQPGEPSTQDLIAARRRLAELAEEAA